jgi:hypothetical protein
MAFSGKFLPLWLGCRPEARCWRNHCSKPGSRPNNTVNSLRAEARKVDAARLQEDAAMPQPGRH